MNLIYQRSKHFSGRPSVNRRAGNRPGASARDERRGFRATSFLGWRTWAFRHQHPQEYGGAGLDALGATIIIEEVARFDGALALIVASHNSLCAGHILNFGSERKKQKYLPFLASGKKLGAWALTEPSSGSDAAALKNQRYVRC